MMALPLFLFHREVELQARTGEWLVTRVVRTPGFVWFVAQPEECLSLGYVFRLPRERIIACFITVGWNKDRSF